MSRYAILFKTLLHDGSENNGEIVNFKSAKNFRHILHIKMLHINKIQ